MDIKSVELLNIKADPEVEGSVDVHPSFFVKTTDGNKMYVPIDNPLNRHYQEVRAWYNAQSTKPFEFEFPAPEEEADRGNFSKPVVPEDLEEAKLEDPVKYTLENVTEEDVVATDTVIAE